MLRSPCLNLLEARSIRAAAGIICCSRAAPPHAFNPLPPCGVFGPEALRLSAAYHLSDVSGTNIARVRHGCDIFAARFSVQRDDSFPAGVFDTHRVF